MKLYCNNCGLACEKVIRLPDDVVVCSDNCVDELAGRRELSDRRASTRLSNSDINDLINEVL
jgi:hypothetical protein